MAISFRAGGSWAFAASGSVTPTLPTHATGDMLLVRVAYKSSAIATCAASTATSGWAIVGTEYHNGTTNSGNGTGSVAVAVFWKEAASASETNPTITFSQTVTQVGHVAISYQKGGSDVWVTPSGGGMGMTVADTTFAATRAVSAGEVTVGDAVDYWYSVCDDTVCTTPNFSISAGSIIWFVNVEMPDTAGTSTVGADGAYDGGYRRVSSGTSGAGNALVQGAISTSETGSAWFTRLRVTSTGTSANAQVATATGAALVGSESITANLGVGTATGAANNATAVTGTRAIAEVASGTGVAANATADTGGITRRQFATGDNGASAAGTVAVTIATPTAGDRMVLAVGWRTNTTTDSTPPGAGGDWTQIDRSLTTSGAPDLQYQSWERIADGGEGTTLTVTLGASALAVIGFVEFYTTGSLALDVDASQASTSTGLNNPTIATGTRANGDEYIVGFLVHNNTSVVTSLNGDLAELARDFTTNATAANNVRIIVGELVTAGDTATKTNSATLDSTVGTVIHVAAYAGAAVVTADAEIAVATGTASAGAVAIAPDADVAAATGTALVAATSIKPVAQVATATGTAIAPSAAIVVNAGAAVGTGVANNATATTTGASTSANAQVATATGAAGDTDATVGATATVGTGTGTALGVDQTLAPTLQSAAGTGAAIGTDATVGATTTATTATGTAIGTDATIAVNAGVAAGTGAALVADGLPGTRGLAQVATATGAALVADGLPGELAPGEVAVAAGAAQNTTAKIAPTLQTATATGAASNATISTSSSVSASANVATGTGAASNVNAKIAPVIQVATGTGAALVADGAPAKSVTAQVATGTGSALLADGAPANVVTTTIAAATGAAIGTDATVGATTRLASATGVAANATVSTQSSGVATAQVAAGTATAVGVTPRVAGTITVATATGAALQAATATGTRANAGVAAGTGVAINASAATQSNVAATAGVATATGAAHDARVVVSAVAAVAAGTGNANAGTIAVAVAAQVAAGTGTAWNPSIATDALIVFAQVATATGTAWDAIGQPGAVPLRGYPSVSPALVGSTIMVAGDHPTGDVMAAASPHATVGNGTNPTGDVDATDGVRATIVVDDTTGPP